MQRNGNDDECEFDQSFFSELAAKDTNDESNELPVLDDVPNMESNGNNDECEFDQSFFSELAAKDTNDESSELPVFDDVPNTRERPGFGIRELRLKRKMQVAANRDPCPDTRDWSKAKRLRADQKGTVVRNDSLPLDILVNKKSAAVATWLPTLGLAEVTQMRGNFWRTTGFCVKKKSYLYPEEALLLAERSVLLVENEGERIEYHRLYEEVIGLITLECHLAYLKLKSLDYLVFRHSGTLRSFEGDADVYKFLLDNTDVSLLKALVAYDVYSHTHKWAKKNMSEPPTAHVVVMTGDLTLSGRVLLRLLEEAKGVPIIFAAIMPTGHVMLEEFSDSLKSLNWENVYAKKIEFKTAVEESLAAENSDQNEALDGSDSESNIGEEEVEVEVESEGDPVEDENVLDEDIPVDNELGDIDVEVDAEEVAAAEAEDKDDDASVTAKSI